jgi:CheY-like chemotaxis protein
MQSSDAPTILVIDDDPAMRMIVSLSLKLCGYVVIAAGNGEEALGVAQANPRIRVIVLDVVMSGLSGTELAARLTAIVPAATVLFCSGHAPSALKRYGIDPASANFLQKPCSGIVLQQKIEELMLAESYASPV